MKNRRHFSKQERLARSKKETEKVLRMTGYYRSLAKHGDERPHSFPDLSCESKAAPTTGIFANATGKRELPAGAKQFPVQTPHKQGPMLLIPSDGFEYAGGKKS